MLSNIKKLREILTRREKLQVVALLVAIIAMAFSQAVGIASVMPFIGLVMEPKMIFENQWLYLIYTTLGFGGIRSFTIFAGVVMFTLIVLSNIIAAFATWLKLRFAWMNNHRLSRRLLEKYLFMPYPFFLNQNSADLSKNVLTEVNQLTVHYLLPMLAVITKSLVALFIFIMLVWVDVNVTIVAIVVIAGAYVAIYWRVNKNLKLRGAGRLQANRMRFKAVNEAFGGIKEIKVMNREIYFLERYSVESFKYARLLSWNAVIGQIPRYALEAIAFGGIIFFVLILLIIEGDARMVIPMASLFAFAGYRLMPALQEIFTAFTQMRFNQAVLERIHHDFIINKLPFRGYRVDRAALPEPISLKNEIKLENISYSYPKMKQPVIDNISLSIKSNSSVAFVGSTGAGKTTLVDIILGLLPPQAGKLLVDGILIDDENMKNWQSNIGYVPQHIYLSDDTISRNIAFGVPDQYIDRDALEQAAMVANIHDFISTELPDGYDTLVGERGIRLSGGQRQRIGVGRALYHDPQVLVFDEATSALDGVTEESVLSAMENAAKLKTLIIIAHRLTTVKNCDVVYMLEKGRITDSGTYAELMEKNKEFQKMAKVGTEGK